MGQVAFFGLITAWEQPALAAVRLKVSGGRITEAEHLFTRSLREIALPNLQSPRPGLLEDVPPEERTSRATMLRAVNAYFDAIERDDGGLAPFAPECARRENGVQTTSNPPSGESGSSSAPPVPGPIGQVLERVSMLGCAAHIDSQILSHITRVHPRRMAVVDEQKGLVVAFTTFEQRGDKRHIELKGIEGAVR